MNNEYSNLNNNEKRGMTPRSLVKFMIATCFSRISSLDFSKIERMKEPFKIMLANERKNHPGEDDKYDKLDEIADGFFEYIKDPDIVEQIISKKLSKTKLEELVLMNVANIPKRKYDMSDLYRQDLIASSSYEPSRRKSKVISQKRGQTYEYIDDNGRRVLITDVGKIGYEEWSGIQAGLSIYQIQKEQENGSFSSDLVCSSIAISDMDNLKYRKAVLNELLSDENIHNAKVGPYIGRISKEKKHDPHDLPHTEKQNANGYYYRIDDEYILEYDSTELTAVIEAVRNNYNRKKMSKGTRSRENIGEDFLYGSTGKKDENPNKSFHDEHGEI